MRAAAARAAAVLTAFVIATAACDSSDPTSSPSAAPPSGSPSASGPASPSPSASDAESVAAFCARLNAFSAVAGPAFDLGAIALIDGETPNERRNVTQLINGMVEGVRLKPDLPPDLGDDLDTVVAAAGAALRKLTDGASAEEATDLLLTEEVKAARDAVVKYRGPC